MPSKQVTAELTITIGTKFTRNSSGIFLSEFYEYESILSLDMVESCPRMTYMQGRPGFIATVFVTMCSCSRTEPPRTCTIVLNVSKEV